MSKKWLNYIVCKNSVRYGQKNIRLNVVSPGLTRTRLRSDFVSGLGGEENAHILYGAAIRREGTPDDMARAAIMINSSWNSFATGAVLYVDGGFHLVHELGEDLSW